MTTTHDDSLGQRTGYDAAFVGQRIEVPAGVDASDAVLVDGSPVVHYTHFSLELSKSRRLCRWVAWNIDGSTLRGPGTADPIGRDDLEFTTDDRIDENLQVADDVYKDNRLDRGHVARRADLLWGDHDEAVRANADSFYFTNITPQMDNFNQSARHGVWGRLENALLEHVDDDNSRVAVLGGPFLSESDPDYRGMVRIPIEFWKVFVYQRDGEIRTRAFIVTQSLDGLKARDPFAEFVTVEKTVEEVAEKARVEFDPVLRELQHRGRPATRGRVEPRAVRRAADIAW
ncbi:DNA/RNA non-specific endonuclease [Mycobacterium sp. URHB0044]|jgi:DNA/RNA endonuclease G (NUC1)|uniref:DNA/RNA non-specific endonuclease n=1 Tax=Mycobacterium sp. URHB0044 TaxID=1380386 RepID=UPI0006867430|nr:DNA/RNA non-specific endonuclease [Mycobacterium sp. URHB0044]